MTITEFLHPLKKASIKKLSLSAMYFAHRFEDRNAVTVEEVKILLKTAQLPKPARSNIAAILSMSAPYVETCGKEGAKLTWKLTATGEDFVRQLLGLPIRDVEIQRDISTLESLVTKIRNKDSRSFVEESLICLKVDALRASVVFLWAGSIRLIQEQIMKKSLKDINTAFGRHLTKPRIVKKIDDLSYFKEKDQLLVSQDLGLYDKNQRSTLDSALDLRNKCGHPGKYNPGPKKVSSFIEDVVNIVF